MSAGFHPYPHQVLLFQLPIELFGFFAMSQASFAEFTTFRIHECNLLEARMIVTSYNQHVRLLSSEPFGWFAPPKSTRGLGADIVMESLPLIDAKRPCCHRSRYLQTRVTDGKPFRVTVPELLIVAGVGVAFRQV